MNTKLNKRLHDTRRIVRLCYFVVGISFVCSIYGCGGNLPVPKNDTDCPGGCSVTLNLMTGSDCTDPVSNGEIITGSLDLVDEVAQPHNSMTITSNSISETMDCGHLFVADVTLEMSDASCTSGKALFVGRAAVWPTSDCSVTQNVCMVKKMCL